MKIKKNGKVINLTEGDLKRIVKKVLNESSSTLEKQFCKDGGFNYDKYYSTECKESENQGRESFEGCKDGKEYVTNHKSDGKTWNQNGFAASRVDWVESSNGDQYICPNDRNIPGIKNK
tara:strand:- start:2459 stop:2815 length:357 start_codon:yes stop_codon:yes gene_type:complete